MRKIYITILVTALFITGCATISVQSVNLADALQQEGKRMHTLNIGLVNSLFESKSQALDKFINEEYIPEELANFKNALPAGTDYNKNFSELAEAIIPKIVDYRNAKHKVLEDAKYQLMEKMNEDYTVFYNASESLKKLLESSVKLDDERKALLDQTKALTNSKIDFDKLSNTIDQIIHKSGTALQDAAELKNAITNP